MLKGSMLKIALCLSLIGMFLLIMIVQFSEPQQTKVILVGDNIGKQVLISGEVTRATQKEDASFLTITDKTASIKVVAFGPVEKLEKGTFVEVVGRVEIYEDELEIVAEQITIQ